MQKLCDIVLCSVNFLISATTRDNCVLNREHPALNTKTNLNIKENYVRKYFLLSRIKYIFCDSYLGSFVLLFYRSKVAILAIKVSKEMLYIRAISLRY